MRIVVVACALAAIPAAMAQDWPSVQLINHSTYQAVDSNGASAYSGEFPLRLRGVVLNNSEDWLDPTPNYTPTYQPFKMGGQAEIFVQATASGDFGGTAAWIGQNYGNLPFKGDPQYSYTNAEWQAELDRLGLFGGPNVAEPVRKGDLVELRARGGLFYAGKQNVNEQHDKSTAKDYEIVILQRNHGLPAPAQIHLSDLKNAGNQFLFDPTRATGPEHYQMTLVELQNVRLTAATIGLWGQNKDLVLEDADGRTLSIHLGLNPSFGSSFAPADWFNVVGILDQSDSSSPYNDGYRLLAMNAGDFTPVPEPAGLGLLAVGAALLLRRRRRA